MKKIIIAKNCSPSRMLSSKEVNATKILISYGGGMGGANKTYYCNSIVRGSDLTDNFTLNLISGEVKEINPNFIVEISAVKLVILVIDVTEHTYYNPEKASKCIRTVITELKFNQDYEISETKSSTNSEQVILDDITT